MLKKLIRGMDTPEHVRRFFLARGQPFIVFRTADILDLGEDDQRLFLDIVAKVFPLPAGGETVRTRIQRLGLRGYCRLPIRALCQKLSIEELQVFQAFCYAYRDVRQAKMEPSVWKPCDCKEATRKTCRYCGGEGRVHVLLEMSAVETALAQGKTWETIDAEEPQ